MTDRDLLMRIMETLGRVEERQLDTTKHVEKITTTVAALQTWKDRWGGALAALSITGAVLGVLLSVSKVYAWVVGG